MTCYYVLIIVSIFERLITLSRGKGKRTVKYFSSVIFRLFLPEDKIEDAMQHATNRKFHWPSYEAGLTRYRVNQKTKTWEGPENAFNQKSFEVGNSSWACRCSRRICDFIDTCFNFCANRLIGTVLGMHSRFGCSCTSRRSWCSCSCNSISEALVNTAFGSQDQTLSIIAFNYFSTTIDSFTFKIDEAAFQSDTNVCCLHSEATKNWIYLLSKSYNKIYNAKD